MLPGSFGVIRQAAESEESGATAAGTPQKQAPAMIGNPPPCRDEGGETPAVQEVDASHVDDHQARRRTNVDQSLVQE
jgi:hypothetical protein